MTDTTQIANLTPGVQVISPNANSDNCLSIRGVSQSDFSEHEESPVAVYSDEVYSSQASGTAGLLFDMGLWALRELLQLLMPPLVITTEQIDATLREFGVYGPGVNR